MAKKFVSKENLQSAWSQKIKPAIDAKITKPTTGSNGQFLKKTEDGTEWADVNLNGFATESFVNQAVSKAKDDLIGGASGTYDTLKEIEDYINTHGTEAAALAAALGNKAEKATTLAGYSIGDAYIGEDGKTITLGTKSVTFVTEGALVSFLSQYVKESELSEKVTEIITNQIEDGVLEGYAKENWVTTQINAKFDEITAYTEQEILSIFE